jgi:cytochrome b pre-mRNA-processing protein 3
MLLASLFGRRNRRDLVHAVYGEIVAQARRPTFFADWGVPDTLDGRFEVLALHAFLVLNRLKAEGEQTADFAQALFDTMFADMDRGLREMGATDIGVGRHVKAMARGFYGRIAAYEAGCAGAETVLRDALRRNLFGTATPADAQIEAVARYVRRQVAALATQPVAGLMAGDVRFAPVGAA